MATQTQAFNLEITGSTETVKSLELINKLIRDSNSEMKALQKTGDATAKTIQNLTKENANLNKQIENNTKELGEVDARMKQLLATNKQASKEYKELKNRKQELLETDKKLTKELATNERQLTSNIEKNQKAKDSLSKLTIEQEKNRLSATKLRKELKEQVKAFDDLNDNIPKDSIVGLGREVTKLTKEYKLLSQAERESAKGKELQKKLVDTKTNFDTLNRSIGDYKSSIGDYRGAIQEAGKGLVKFGSIALGVFGVGSAISVASTLVSNAKQTIKDFNQAIVDLGNDTTISNEHLEQLSQIAIDLSGGKLGTTAESITKIFGFLANASPELADNVVLLKQVAEQVNILSKAEKANAEVVAGVVTTAAQNFNISLADSAKIVDTLAHASDNGKAKLPELADAIKEGGVVAGQVGIPLKEYLDIIQATSQVGLKGADTAGKLNKVLLTLAKTGDDELNPALRPMSEILKTLDERFGATAGSTDALQKATDLFSTKNAAFVLTLIQQRDALTDLNAKQVEFNGALADALNNSDTLIGKVNELGGEWNKLILGIENGESGVSDFFKVATEGLIGFLQLLQDGDTVNKLFLATVTAGPLGLLAQLQNTKSQAEKDAESNFRNAPLLNALEKMRRLSDEAGASYEELLKMLAPNPQTVSATDSVKAMRDQLKILKDELIIARDEGDNSAIRRITADIEKLENKLGVTHKAVKTFIEGSLGFLNEQISKLNTQLQNTTNETVITATTKQISDLQAVVTKLQAQIDKANTDAQREQNKRDLNAPSRGVVNPFDIFGKPSFQADNLFGNSVEEQQKADEQLFQSEEAARQKRIEADEKEKKDTLERNKQTLEANLDLQRLYNDSLVELVSGFSDVFASLFDAQREDSKEVFKDLLLLTLKFAEQQVLIFALAANTQAAIAAAANPVLLLKLGLQKAVISALIGAAFGALRGLVSQFEEGGMIEAKHGIPFRQPGSSDDRLIHVKKGEAVINEKQQAKIKRLAGDGIFSQAGVKGFKRSPMNNKVVMQNSNNFSAVTQLSPDSIDQLSVSVADAIINKNREVERKRLAGL